MGCYGSSFALEGVNVNLDAAPCESDCRLHQENAVVLEKNDEILEALRNYQSCTDSCRKALSEKTPKTLYEALLDVTKVAQQVHMFFKHSEKISNLVVLILKVLVSDIPSGRGRIDPLKDIQFEKHSALLMQLCIALSFIIRFDNLKSLNATIQNDLSMYRRMCQISKKGTLNNEEEKEYLDNLENWTAPNELDTDTVSAMSFFIASPIPFMSQTVTKLQEFAANDNRVDETLPYVPNLYLALVNGKCLGESSDKYPICLEAMACSVIITDRVEPEGVFHSQSNVQVSECIVLLKRFVHLFPEEKIDTEQLLNGLRYWTIHIQDTTTPSSITKKLDV